MSLTKIWHSTLGYSDLADSSPCKLPFNSRWLFCGVFCACVVSGVRVVWLTFSLDFGTPNAIESVERKVHLGEIFEGDMTTCRFVIRNTTAAPFVVKRLVAGCLCQTDKSLVGKHIQVGESFAVPMKLPNNITGPTESKLDLMTNSPDPEFSRIPLSLAAVIKPCAVTSPTDVWLTKMHAPKRVTIDLNTPELRTFPGAIKIDCDETLLDVVLVLREAARIELAVGLVEGHPEAKTTRVCVGLGDYSQTFTVHLAEAELRVIPVQH